MRQAFRLDLKKFWPILTGLGCYYPDGSQIEKLFQEIIFLSEVATCFNRWKKYEVLTRSTTFLNQVFCSFWHQMSKSISFLGPQTVANSHCTLMHLGHIHSSLLFEVTFRHFLTRRFSYNLVIFGIFLPISPKVQENKGLQNHHEFFKNPVRFLDIKNASVCTVRRFYSYQK